MADSPDVRIGTAEREHAMRRLSDHFAAGRLSVAEFDERSAVVAAAVTRGDLVTVFADLPEPVAQESAPAPSPRSHKSELQGSAVGLIVIAALVLFFLTHTWLWFLLIPAAAIAFGANGQRNADRRRRERRQEHRDRRRER